MKLMSLLVLFWSAAAFSQNYGTPELTFTGYKFTEKEAVSGTFKKINWNFTKSGAAKDVIPNTTAVIDSYSIEAGKPARNTNITKGLFKKWGGQNINVKVTGFDVASQIAQVQISIGKLSRVVPFKVSESHAALVFVGSIDLIEFGLGKAFQSLSKLCAVHHKGKDGIVKTWSVVDLEVKLPKVAAN